MSNKRFEDKGLDEIVKEMIERDGKSATYRALSEVVGQAKAISMIVGENGGVSLSELTESMSPDEALEYLATFKQEDE